MLRLVKTWLLVLILCTVQPLYADSAEVTEAVQSNAEVEEKVAAESEGLSGLTIAILVFVGAILFVVSSATAMNALGGKPPRKQGNHPSPQRKKVAEGRDRFRL